MYILKRGLFFFFFLIVKKMFYEILKMRDLGCAYASLCVRLNSVLCFMLRATKTSGSPKDRCSIAIQRVREVFAFCEGKGRLRFISEYERRAFAHKARTLFHYLMKLSGYITRGIFNRLVYFRFLIKLAN